MSRIQAVNPDRILWCCAERGITPDELASKLQIASGTFQQMLEGNGSITFKQLQRVASFFGRGILFFLEPDDVVAEDVHTPQFRTITNQKPDLSPKVRALIERVERQRGVYLGLLEELGDTDLPVFDPPTLPTDDIPKCAAIARKWLGLADTNTFDTYRDAVESKSVLVFRSNGYNGPWQIAKDDPVCGFTLSHSVYPVIVIKKEATESRQSFTLVHELGHLLLHQGSFVDDEDDLFSAQGNELQANLFAAHVLVPEAFLALINDADRPNEERYFDTWLRPYREAWGVSGEVLLIRLLNTGRLSQEEYQNYRRWRNSLTLSQDDGGNRLYRYREPKHVFGNPFVKAVLDALHGRQISLARASSYLDNLKIADVHQLEGYYASL